MSEETYLRSISIQNFRCFHDLNVEFGRHQTVLVANNGQGKTAVLDAVAIALSAFVGAFHNGKRDGIRKDDVRVQVMPGDVLQMEPQYPCVLGCEGVFNGSNIHWERRSNTPKSKNTFKEANALIESGRMLQGAVSDGNGSVSLPLIAYYGTGRLWSQKKITEKKVFNSEFYSRTAGYLDCLDPSSSYKFFVDWFRYTSESHKEIRDQNEERFGERGLKMPTPYGDGLSAVSKAVDCCLAHTGWKGLRYSSIHQAPVVEHSVHGVLEVSQLSDGIRNMIAMVADIAYRATRLNNHFKTEAAIKTPGIVLIDEVDMHLHPEWQHRVLRQLRKAFPCVQFVMTTHSPQVLTSIKSEDIRLLDVSVDGEELAAVPLAESYARSNEDVLLAVMDVEPVPDFPEKKLLQEYGQIIEQGDLDQANIDSIQQELEEKLGADHPELIRLELTRQRREALG